MATLQGDEIYGIILGRIERVEDGNLGDCEPVGDGVFELKIDFGPGYRVYFGEDDDLVILLWGEEEDPNERYQDRQKALEILQCLNAQLDTGHGC
jgi:putative addiction module killer protein